MQMQSCRSRYAGVFFLPRAVENGSNKHSDAYETGIRYLQPDLGSTDVWIEDWPDVPDSPREDPIRIGIQMNIRILAETHLRQIVLVHVAKYPDARHVR